MDNKKAKKYRQNLEEKNYFNIVKLMSMPKYFGWVNYYIKDNLKIKNITDFH